MHQCSGITQYAVDWICIARLRAEGLLSVQEDDPHFCAVVRTLDVGPVDAAICIAETNTEVLVTFSTATESRQARINLRSAECNLGGVRVWFSCPRCARQVMHVYATFAGPSLLCRRCAGICYESAAASREERLHIKRRKIAEKLRCLVGPASEPFGLPPQPRRMRYTTYARLLQELWDADLAILAAGERWTKWLQGRTFPAGSKVAALRRQSARKLARRARSGSAVE